MSPVPPLRRLSKEQLEKEIIPHRRRQVKEREMSSWYTRLGQRVAASVSQTSEAPEWPSCYVMRSIAKKHLQCLRLSSVIERAELFNSLSVPSEPFC